MLLALALGLAPWSGRPARAASAVLDARLQDALRGAERVGAVVVFRGDGAPAAADLQALRDAGVTSGLSLRSLPIAGALLTQAQVTALAARPEVRAIYLNRRLAYDNAEATALTGVDRVRRDAAMTSRNGGLPISGAGVSVLVNDSGIDGTHADLQYGPHLVQNVAGATNLNAVSSLLPITYVENVPNTDSTGGHGTHVAGIVGGTGARSGGLYEGVAPGASLIGYGSGAALFLLDTLGGFDYALTHQAQYGIRVITNSWGDTGDTGTAVDPNDPITIATKRAYDRGIVVVFSAGNSGPGESTITGNYKKAPWVIAVAAGTKQGTLADFSSRGVAGRSGSFTIDGERWTYEDRPTVTAPGESIISTRAIAPDGLLGTDPSIPPAYQPFYTNLSGTSMAAPHVAGIVALMLDANPALSPLEVKQIIQQTATNIPGHEAWEVGAGYVNAYAAVDRALNQKSYGSTVNAFRTFNSSATISVQRSAFSIDYNPVTFVSPNRHTFNVPAGLSELAVRVDAAGVQGETGNPLNLVLIAPDGSEVSSGISLLFPLYYDRTVVVSAPAPGTWAVELRGLRGDPLNPVGAGLPETVEGEIAFKAAGAFSGLSDIAGHPAEAAIKVAVSERLVDGYASGSYKPSQNLTRGELARYLVMGAGVRQLLPAGRTFADVAAADVPFVEAAVAAGAALRDVEQRARGVVRPISPARFSPDRAVTRAELAYTFVQSLGLEADALARNGGSLTVQHGGQRIPIDDAADVPADLRGYVQLALDLNILNAYFSVTQGPFDLQPVVRATFKPASPVTRGEYAVVAGRFYSAYLLP